MTIADVVQSNRVTHVVHTVFVPEISRTGSCGWVGLPPGWPVRAVVGGALRFGSGGGCGPGPGSWALGPGKALADGRPKQVRAGHNVHPTVQR